MSQCESEHMEAPEPECGRGTVRTSLWAETLGGKEKQVWKTAADYLKILATRCHQEPTGLKKRPRPPSARSWEPLIPQAFPLPQVESASESVTVSRPLAEIDGLLS